MAYPGEGEDLQGAEGESLVKGMDDGADSGACGEDVVDEEEGGMGGGAGGGKRGCWRGFGIRGLGQGFVGYRINIVELGFALVPGEAFVAEGRAGFAEQGGEIMALEAGNEGLSEKVEGGRR